MDRDLQTKPKKRSSGAGKAIGIIAGVIGIIFVIIFLIPLMLGGSVGSSTDSSITKPSHSVKNALDKINPISKLFAAAPDGVQGKK